MSKNKTNVTKEAFKQLFKKGDIILLVVVLVLVAPTIYFALQSDASEANVYVDGNLVYKLDLNKNATGVYRKKRLPQSTLRACASNRQRGRSDCVSAKQSRCQSGGKGG